MPKKILSRRPKRYQEDTKIKKRNLIFYDLEFSGLEVQHEIIEIGCLIVEQPSLKIIKEWNAKVQPKHIRNADKNALDLIGYSAEEWKDAITLKEALTEFNSLAKNGVLVGYNSAWDFLFLKKSYHDEKIKPEFHWQTLDVLSMAYCKLRSKRKIKGFRMTEVLNYFDIKNVNWHDALEDARVTYKLFLEISNGKS